MSIVYKERERERERDVGGRTSYTTVRRYRVPDLDDPDNTSVVKERDLVIRRERDPPSATREVKEYRVEREVEREPRRDVEYRVLTKEREVETPRRDIEYKVVEREREIERSPAPRDVRYDREIVRVPSPPSDHLREYRDRLRDSYDLERYTRSVDYYQPQPIIIRQEPQQIIIKEAPREPLIIERRDEVRDDRALVRRDEQRQRDDEDYYYERRTREVDRGPRRDGGGEHFDERDHRHRRDHDAASHRDDYSSDEDVYVRKEKIVERSRSTSPHHKRHLAEGAIAGIGAAEILRHHRKQKGEDPGHRGRQLVGSAALGAVGAEVLSRARSHARSHRSRSRSWSRSSDEDDYRRNRHHKHRSRSRSKSRIRQLGGVAAVAAVGALAGYALRNRNKQPQIIERRSRSRIRRASLEREPLTEERRSMSASPVKKPDNRNRHIAQAGLASAAAAALWERVRSKSRKGKDRSRSKLREAVPIVAAGLGGSALAGLYERNKAKKEAKRAEADRDFSRSPSRSRSRGTMPYGDERHAVSDPAMIEYGQDPIYTEHPGEYRRRHRGSSSDSSPDRRRHSRSRSPSRSRTRGLAEAAAAAGVAAVGAHELTKRSERKKAEKERRRREREEEMYSQEHPPYTPPPMGPNAGGYTPQQEYYPQSNSFPPPPANEYAPREEFQPYNPADYPPPPGATPAPRGEQPYPASPGAGDHPHDTTGYVPNETFAGDTRYDPDAHQHHDQARRAAENVSPNPGTNPADDLHDGMRSPPRSKSVAFDVSPARGARRPDGPESDTETLRPRRRRRPRSRSAPEVDSLDSESTEDLPPRFDEQGRRVPEQDRRVYEQRPGGSEPFMDKLQDILAGRGTAGGLFKRLAGDLFSDEGRRRR